MRGPFLCSDEPDIIVPDNYAPTLNAGDAGVFYDNQDADDIWFFEAEVNDADGLSDIVGVWADVYDEGRGGVLVESFELFPTDDPYVWYSDWLGATTLLNPFYPSYTVDLVVYDTYEDMDYLTITPLTY